MGNDLIEISVIITAYNYAQFIERAILSVMDQKTSHSFETIVVVRPSGDGTEQILDKFKGIRVIIQDGAGLSNASNLGIINSKGKYIIRLDADDIFLQGILEKEMNVLRDNNEIDFIYPDYYIIIFGERKLKKLPEFDPDELKCRGDFLSGGTMYRKDLFNKVGMFDESLRTLESYEFILRLITNNIKGGHISEPLFEYNIHGTSMSDDVALCNIAGKAIAERYGIIYRKNINHPREIPER
jgi:glycosyltransferase involved in cell wall biosynthesis